MGGKKYLITGGHGKLGTHLREHLDSVSPTRSEMDILDLGQLDKVVGECGADAIVHLAAISDQKLAGRERLESYRVNVIGTRNVAAAAKAHGLKVFYTSTDYVFPGEKGGYSENDTPEPPNWYGYTKYAGELEIMNLLEKYCIMRTSFRPDGWGFPTAYTNVYTSADYVDVIAKEIALCIGYDLQGIVHVGTKRKSFFELAKERNPEIKPEECTDPDFPRLRDMDTSRWEAEKKKRGA